MRTRSVQLVTSWWVVCVWAVLSLATGLVSVVAILQPAWYVRYSEIHAQDAQGVAFQVMVSSVGPLGYCRLAGVRQVTIAEEESRTRHVKPLSGSQGTTQATLWTSPFSTSTGASEHPLETPQRGLTSTPKPTAATTKSLLPSRESRPTTLSAGVAQAPSPSANRDIGGETGVSTDGGSPLEAMEETTTITTTTITTTTISTTTTVEDSEANRSDEILTTTRSFIVDSPTQADAEEQNFQPKEPKSISKLPGTSKEESSSAEMEVATPRAGEEVGRGSSSRGDGKRGLARPHSPAVGSRGKARKNATAPGKGRKKKGKHRRKKKKNRRKRPTSMEGRKITGRNHGRAAPRPDQPLHHLLRSRLNDLDDPLDRPFLQPRPRLEKLISADYRPRPPVLYCSGVGGGVGSGSSAVWALVGALYGVAGVVQVSVGVASLALHLPHSHTHARRYIFAAWLGNVQVAIVMSQGVALVLFPLGLGSPLARGECGGSSSVYWPGECSFGWSYMLGVVATTLAAYCPCLARLTVFRKYDYKDWDSINFF